MKRIVVYGLGNNFESKKNIIEGMYDVVGYCDKDINKIKKYINGCTREELSTREDYDAVLVTVKDYTVVTELVQNLGIERDKIIYFCGMREYNSVGQYIPAVQFYGQFMDDAVLALLFEKIGVDYSKIKYLELGVYDPVEINNTYYFSQMGAEGVLVDANPAIEEKCKIFRPRDVFMNYAVSAETQNEKIPFYIAENKGLSSLHKDIIDKHATVGKLGAKLEQVMDVEVIGINDLLGRIGFAPNLVSIDIEGEDWNVITAWNFEKYRPAVIILEMTGKKIIDYMKNNNYIWFSSQGSNSVFVDAYYQSKL